MKARDSGAALTRHTLRRILEGQGPDAAKAVLESFGPPGDALREHAKTCTECGDVVRELYRDRETPVNDDPLTPELLQFLREC